MITEPLFLEEYENEDVYFRVYKYEDHDVYWLRIGGCCGLEVREPQLQRLHELLNAYMEEEYNG